MPESDTSFTQRSKGVLKEHRGKAATVATATLTLPVAIYLFVGKDSFSEHCHQCDRREDKCIQKGAEQWRKLADFDLKLDEIRMKIDRLERPHGFNGDSTNVLTIVAPIPTLWPTNTPLAVIR